MPLSRQRSKQTRQRHKAQAVCKSCKTTLSIDSVKCPKCGTYQKWINALTSTTGVALLLSLATFGVLISPKVSNFIFQPRTEMVGSLQSASLEGLSVLVTNTGKRAGTFRGANLEITDKSCCDGEIRGALTTFSIKNEGASGSMIVQANSSALFELEPDYQDGWMFAGSENICFIRFFFTHSDGSYKYEDTNIDCSRIQDYSLMLGAKYKAARRTSTPSVQTLNPKFLPKP